jgi:hypothetical protein
MRWWRDWHQNLQDSVRFGGWCPVSIIWHTLSSSQRSVYCKPEVSGSYGEYVLGHNRESVELTVCLRGTSVSISPTVSHAALMFYKTYQKLFTLKVLHCMFPPMWSSSGGKNYGWGNCYAYVSLFRLLIYSPFNAHVRLLEFMYAKFVMCHIITCLCTYLRSWLCPLLLCVVPLVLFSNACWVGLVLSFIMCMCHYQVFNSCTISNIGL